MNRTPVKSSNIKSVGHDPVNNVAEVEFSGGKVFHYQGVNAGEFEKLCNSKSIGSHFATHIKGKPCTCIS